MNGNVQRARRRRVCGRVPAGQTPVSIAPAGEHPLTTQRRLMSPENSQRPCYLCTWEITIYCNMRGSGAGAAACGMECGVAASGFPAPAPRAHPALSPTERSPAKAGLHVNFSDKGEVKERREKFLTAKYGSHQMALIRKRLAVEMWLYDELQKLYEIPKESSGAAGAQEVEVDIDELLDMDTDDSRRRHLATLLADAKKPQKDVHKFINELLDKAKTL